ncbi:hypothetical protein GINT2_001491 [Glugoides intestinalis]
MFMTIWKPILKSKAKEIVFSEEGMPLSNCIEQKYNEMKLAFSYICDGSEDVSKKDHCINICKKMLRFYQECEEILQNIVFEAFNESFVEEIEKKRNFFEISNKIFKLMMHFDVLKAKNSSIFAQYTEMRLNNTEEFRKKIDDAEDDKISMFNLISMPMGRLFLSMFTSTRFDLQIPLFLGKISKVYLNEEYKKRLCLFIYLSETHQWKYVFLFMNILFERSIGSNGFNFPSIMVKNYQEYSEMLKRHS